MTCAEPGCENEVVSSDDVPWTWLICEEHKGHSTVQDHICDENLKCLEREEALLDQIFGEQHYG